MPDNNFDEDVPTHEAHDAQGGSSRLASDDLQAVADLFEIFFRWDDEAKARKGGTTDGAAVLSAAKHDA